jgi:hypothetical protein
MKIGDAISDKDATTAAAVGGSGDGDGMLIEAHADWVSNDEAAYSANGEPLRVLVDQVMAVVQLPTTAGNLRSADGDANFYKDLVMGGRTDPLHSTTRRSPEQSGTTTTTTNSVQSASIQTEYTVPGESQNIDGVTILPNSTMGKSNAPLPIPAAPQRNNDTNHNHNNHNNNNNNNNNNNSHHSSRMSGDEAEAPTRTTSNKARVASLQARRRCRRQVAIYLVLLIGVGCVMGAIFWWWGQPSSTDPSSTDDSNRAANESAPNAEVPITPVASPTQQQVPIGNKNARPAPFVLDDTASRTTNIINYINSVTYTGQQLTPSNASSASLEEQALQWILDVDPILSTMVPDRIDHQVRIRQRYALTTLWIILWKDMMDALWRQDECEWTAIACVVLPILGTQSSMNVVTEINGPNSDWIGFGSISPDLGLFDVLDACRFELQRFDGNTAMVDWKMDQFDHIQCAS